jgi:hypothetical protein|tara:strand:- start:892 stop:1302 length:411 start_codon:yes stop_codon:yes gene_type:complete
MERLPEEVVDIIFSFVPINLIYNLNHLYIENIYSLLIKNKTIDKTFNSYIKHIIRYDCSMFLNKIFENKFLYLTSLSNWKYNSHTFPNYIEYLRAYTIEFSKTKCRNLIELYISKEPVSVKNRHKKIRRRNIKWSN